MPNQSLAITRQKFYCEICDYRCSKQSDFYKHTSTRKHIIRINPNENDKNVAKSYTCDCGKEYKHMSSLCNHRKKCEYTPPSNNVNTVENKDQLILELLKQNKEFQNLILDQNEKMVEMSKQIGNNNNNTINNTTNKFNLSVFLNETCKDAINLNDFIQSIELNSNDFIRTGEIGYVRGISDIMVERIRDMEPHTRPIHCTDLKRETVYVKDSDKWSKEDENKTHLRKAVKIVAGKNKAQVHTWIKQNPNYEILDTPECDKYFEYTKASLGGYGKEEDMKFENKIMNNVLKETVIDKNLLE